MMRWSARVTPLILAAVLVTGCQNNKKQDEVAQVPDETASSLDALAPVDSTASSLMPADEPAAQPAAQYEAPAAEPVAHSPNVHVMKPKDTLYSLAVKYYSDGKQWRRILEANKARISDPKKIPVGTKLIIP